jgi:hypothetical protein
MDEVKHLYWPVGADARLRDPNVVVETPAQARLRARGHLGYFADPVFDLVVSKLARGSVEDLPECPPPTLVVRVVLADESGGPGENAGAGVLVKLNAYAVGRTRADGTVTVHPPQGHYQVEAEGGHVQAAAPADCRADLTALGVAVTPAATEAQIAWCSASPLVFPQLRSSAPGRPRRSRAARADRCATRQRHMPGCARGRRSPGERRPSARRHTGRTQPRPRRPARQPRRQPQRWPRRVEQPRRWPAT